MVEGGGLWLVSHADAQGCGVAIVMGEGCIAARSEAPCDRR